MENTDNATKANARTTQRVGNVSNRGKGRNAKNTPIPPPATDNNLLKPDDQNNQQRSRSQSHHSNDETPLLQSNQMNPNPPNQVTYEQMVYYEAGDIVFVPREDFLWPGKIVKPSKDYKTYTVKQFQGKKAEKRSLGQLLDYSPENRAKCQELFARRQQEQALQKSMSKALATAEMLHRDILRREEQAKRKELAQKDKEIEQQIFKDLVQMEKQRTPFDENREEQGRKGRRQKNTPQDKVVNFTQKKALYESRLEKAALEKMQRLRKDRQQRENRDQAARLQESVYNNEAASVHNEPSQTAPNIEISHNAQPIENVEQQPRLQQNIHEQQRQEQPILLQPQPAQIPQAMPVVDEGKEVELASIQAVVSSPKIVPQQNPLPANNMENINQYIAPMSEEINNQVNNANEERQVSIARPEESSPQEIEMEANREIIQAMQIEQPLPQNAKISTQGIENPVQKVPSSPMRHALSQETPKEEANYFKMYFPQTPQPIQRSHQGHPTTPIQQKQHSPFRKSPSPFSEQSKKLDFLSQYKELDLALSHHLQEVGNFSEDYRVELCETAIDTTIKALTEPAPNSRKPSFLRLLYKILLGQGLPLERLMASKILPRMALFVRVYEGIVRDCELLAEYNFFAGYCRTVRERCRACGVEMQSRLEQMLEKARVSE